MKTSKRILVLCAALFATSLTAGAADMFTSASIMNLPLRDSAAAHVATPRAPTVPAANLKGYFRTGTRTEKDRSARDRLFVAAMGAIVIAGAFFGRCRTSSD